MSEDIIMSDEADPLTRMFAAKMERDAEASLRIQKRVDVIMWIGIGLLLLASLAVVIRSINYYELRGQVDAKSDQLGKVTEVNTELVRRVNRLRGELALRDARFQASKSIAQKGGQVDDLLMIQAIIDRFALEHLRNGNSEEMTADDVRREVCIELEKAGYPCLP